MATKKPTQYKIIVLVGTIEQIEASLNNLVTPTGWEVVNPRIEVSINTVTLTAVLRK